MISKLRSKGLSAVISTVILVLLVVVISSIVWIVVDNMIKEKTESASSCFGIMDKVYIEDRGTCYNSSSGELKVYVSVRNIEVEKVLLSVSGKEGAESFEIPSDDERIRAYGDELVVPGKNSGKVYNLNLSGLNLGSLYSVKLVPVINGEPCEASDELREIVNCASLS